MKFNSSQDIEAPIDFVFACASDFERFETQALRAGVRVERQGGSSGIVEGTTWRVAGKLRGKERKFVVELVDLIAPHNMVLTGKSKGYNLRFEVTFIELSKRKTRMSAELQLRANTIASRLLMQSARLARSRLNRRYNKRLRAFADDIMQRYAGANA